MIEIVPFCIILICISYLILGCAGHKSRRGESKMPSEMVSDNDPVDSQAEPASATSGMNSKPMPSETTPKDQSLAGYQSQTSEILAGPGEDPLRSTMSSATSRHSHISKAGNSALGSRLSSSNVASRHHDSRFGSTLDSSAAMGSRAAGGGTSVLSMLSKSGHSNLSSNLSSNRSGAQASGARSGVLESTMSRRSGKQGQASVLSASSGLGRGHSQASAMGSSMQPSGAGSSMAGSAAGSSMRRSSMAGSSVHSALTGGRQSTLSRQQISSVSVSGSSPVSNTSALSSMHSGAKSTSKSPAGNSTTSSAHSAHSVTSSQNVSAVSSPGENVSSTSTSAKSQQQSNK